jgi:exo-beta-1,3-glucanase (GH17 family)
MRFDFSLGISFKPCHFVLTGLIILSTLNLCSCTTVSDATDMPSPIPSATLTLTPTPTFTPTPTPFPTPTPTIGPQSPRCSGDCITYENGPSCLREFSPETLVLGGDAASCNPGEQGGSVTFMLPVPEPSDAHLVVMRIVCPAPEGCASTVNAQQAGTLSLIIDGQTLWTATCSAPGQCDDLALGESPVVAFRNNGLRQHHIRLETSPGISWAITHLESEIEWIEIPDLIQGIAYTPFRDCQSPHINDFPTELQLREDLALVKHIGNAIRTYSTQDIQRFIPVWAQEAGLRVSAGAWLGPDLDVNEEEITALIELAHTMDLESVIVGNEVLLRGDLTEEQLIEYIERVKANVDVPVTTAEIGHILLQHPDLMQAVDYLMVHIYAYWDGQPIEVAARYVVDTYQEIQAASGTKRVVIGETGWPSGPVGGPAHGDAVPSPENQRRFLREFLALAHQENVEFYYFAAFDELWKTEGGVGPYWGIMYADRSNKYDLQSVMIPLTEPSQVLVTTEPVATPTGTPVAPSKCYVYLNYGAEENKFIPSGWMGDIAAISFDDCSQQEHDWADRTVKVQYLPSPEDERGWAGIYWLYPENNWGVARGHNLQELGEYAQLRFSAKSDQTGAQVRFFVGGVYSDTYRYLDSIPEPLQALEADSKGFVSLSTEWQEYHIDLTGADLSNVIGGFGWAAERNRTPNGVTFYIDNILFDIQPPPTLTPTPIPTRPPATPTPPLTPTPDMCPVYDAEEVNTHAWTALENGDFVKAVACTDKVIQTWSSEAQQQQDERVQNGICEVTPDPGDPVQVEEYWNSYWAVNYVAASWFIRGEAFRRQERWSEAREFYKMVENYYCAYAWDPQGWFWNLAQGAREKNAQIP